MKRKYLFVLFMFQCLFLPSLFIPQHSEAIPAFAREQKVSCSFCHVGFPKLNAVGIAFKQNGYRMPGSKGTYLWEKPIPLAFRVNFAAAYTSRQWNIANPSLRQVPPGGAFGEAGEVRTNKQDLAFQIQNWQILAGGTLAPDVSFFLQVVGSGGAGGDELGFPAPTAGPNEAEIETEALVGQIDDILPNGLLNLRFGKDHIDHLFLSRPRRITQAPYLTLFQPVTGASLHANSVGVELNGFTESGLWYSMGVRNMHPRFNSKDNREFRPGAYYATLNIPFMEANTLGLLFATDQIGNDNAGAPGPPNFPNTSGRTFGMGGALDLHWGDFNLIPAAYYYREEGDIHGGNDLNTYSGTAELHYFITNTLISTVRYDYLNVFGESEGTFEDDIDQFVVNLAWYFHPNVRVIAEYSYLNAELNRLTTFPFNTRLFTSVPGQLLASNTRAELEANQIILGLELGF